MSSNEKSTSSRKGRSDAVAKKSNNNDGNRVAMEQQNDEEFSLSVPQKEKSRDGSNTLARNSNNNNNDRNGTGRKQQKNVTNASTVRKRNDNSGNAGAAKKQRQNATNGNDMLNEKEPGRKFQVWLKYYDKYVEQHKGNTEVPTMYQGKHSILYFSLSYLPDTNTGFTFSEITRQNRQLGEVGDEH